MVVFREQLERAGALNIADPAKSMRNALAMKATQTNIKTAELNQTSKLIDIGTGLLKNVLDRDDYGGYYGYMGKIFKELGMDNILPAPDSFESEGDLQKYQNAVLLSRKDNLKISEGQRANYTAILENGKVVYIENKTLKEKDQIEKNLGLKLLPGRLEKESYDVLEKRSAAKKRGEVSEAGPSKKKDIADIADQIETDKIIAFETETDSTAGPREKAKFKSEAKTEARKQVEEAERAPAKESAFAEKEAAFRKRVKNPTKENWLKFYDALPPAQKGEFKPLTAYTNDKGNRVQPLMKPDGEIILKTLPGKVKEPTGLTVEQRELNAVRSDYFQTLNNADRAKRGEGQFVTDENAAKVAAEGYERAEILKQRYIDLGGDAADLGGVEEEMETPESAPAKIPEDEPQIEIGAIMRNDKTGERRRWDGENWLLIP